MKSQSKEATQLKNTHQQFLSGDYKNCLNLLQKLIKNQGEKNLVYHHNYNICEYMQNRSPLQASNTLNKLIDLLAQVGQKKTNKKSKEEPFDASILKYNISVLMGVIGKRDNMEMILKDLYYSGPNQSSWKYAFLLLETELLLDRKFDCVGILNVLQKTKGLPKTFNEKDQKQNKIKFAGLSLPDNSISDQGKYSQQQYRHLLHVMKILVFIKFGLLKQASYWLPKKQNSKLWQGIKDGAFHYKNSNLFELNLLTMTKFASAQLEYELGNYQKSLKLLNPSNLMQAEINSNRYWVGSGHLALNNIGLINFKLQKYTLALFYISKSLQNLTKFSIVNSEQRQQLICQHYQSRHEFVLYNQALMLLKLGKAKQAYQHFSSLQKITKNYKFWYRFGQATLKYFHTLLKQNSEINQSNLYSEIIDNHQPSYSYPNVPYVKDEKKGKAQPPHKGPYYKRYVLQSVDHFFQEDSEKQNITKTQSSLIHLKTFLDTARSCFQNALLSIQQQDIEQQVSSLDGLNSDNSIIEQIKTNKTKQNLIKEHHLFKQSILISLAYISLCKQQYPKTIKICQQILSLPQISSSNGYTASMYLIQAYLETQRTKQAIEVSQNKHLKPGLRSSSTVQQFRDSLCASQTRTELLNPDTVMKYNMAVLHIRGGNLPQANLIITKFLNELGIVPSSYIANIPTYVLNLLIYWNLRIDHASAALQLIKHRRILSTGGSNKTLLKIVK